MVDVSEHMSVYTTHLVIYTSVNPCICWPLIDIAQCLGYFLSSSSGTETSEMMSSLVMDIQLLEISFNKEFSMNK